MSGASGMALWFGPRISIPSSQSFYQSRLSFAFVNISPVVPGHMLVSPLARTRPRLSDLTEEETADLFLTGRLVARAAQRVFNCPSATFAVQDGPEAGQTVAHVHLHIIPRRGGDFARNDDVYQGIEEPARVRRTEEAMAAEAVLMREAVAEQVVMSRAEDLAREHFEKYGVDESHGIAHALKVLSNCNQALFFEKERRNTSDRLATMLAALLHDADDRKYFGDEASLKLLNARRIAAEAGASSREVETMAEMISLVSASKNKNGTISKSDEWKLLPRFSDRLEAIGWQGVLRCWEYNRRIGAPISVPETARVTNEEELAKAAPPSRFAAYNGDSASFIDHFYDKLVHVCVIDSENSFFRESAATRRKELLDFLFEFGRSGVVNQSVFATKE